MYLIALFGTNISGRELLVYGVVALVVVVAVLGAWSLIFRRR